MMVPQTLAEVRLRLLGSGTVSEIREMLGLGRPSDLIYWAGLRPTYKGSPLTLGQKRIKDF